MTSWAILTFWRSGGENLRLLTFELVGRDDSAVTQLGQLGELVGCVSRTRGVLVYLIARGGSMQARAQQQAQQADADARAYIQEAAGSGSTADQLTKLAELRDRGVITPEEFEREKAKVLA